MAKRTLDSTRKKYTCQWLWTRQFVVTVLATWVSFKIYIECVLFSQKTAPYFRAFMPPPTPITLVLDNARYQRCNLVIDLALELGIELLFLPPYSPNLNLIERLWKLTKKECLNSKYYNNFALFSGAILTFLTTMHSTHKSQLDSLLTLKFQLFTEEQVQKGTGRRFDQPTLRSLPAASVTDCSAKSNEEALEKAA